VKSTWIFCATGIAIVFFKSVTFELLIESKNSMDENAGNFYFSPDMLSFFFFLNPLLFFLLNTICSAHLPTPMDLFCLYDVNCSWHSFTHYKFMNLFMWRLVSVKNCISEYNLKHVCVVNSPPPTLTITSMLIEVMLILKLMYESPLRSSALASLNLIWLSKRDSSTLYSALLWNEIIFQKNNSITCTWKFDTQIFRFNIKDGIQFGMITLTERES